MERYNLSKKLGSYLLDIDSIKQLEKYLNYRLSKKLKGVLSGEERFEPEYSVKIKDSIGEEHISSIDQYHRDKFPNDIKDVVVEYSINIASVKVRIRFSREVLFSEQEIDIRCEGAKEVALGIKSEIESILKDKKTIHYIFYGKYAWLMWLILMISMNSWAWINFKYSSQVFSFLTFSGLAYFGARFISPYTSFDTSRLEKREKFTSWILNGLAGVFLFGVLGIYLRDHLL